MARAGLDIGAGLTLPFDAITQTIGIVGKRGVGKTHTATVIAEEMLEHDWPVVVLDPIGVWWGLRSSRDGRKRGYPILVIGGEHGDLPLEASAGRMIAEFVIAKRASVVVDMGLLSKSDQARFVTDFLERVYQRNRDPLHLILDEADAFAPQRIRRGFERTFGAVDTAVRRGRARGLGLTLVTQRSAAINKDVLTQIEVLVVHRTMAPQDRAAVDAWVEVHADATERSAVTKTMHQLEKGEAWIWSPAWLELLKRVRIRQRRTFDSSATPKMGARARRPRALAAVDVEAFRDQLASLVEKADQEDPKRLQSRIRQLEAEITKLQRVQVKVEPVEIPAVTPKDRQAFERTATQVVKRAGQLQTSAHQLLELGGAVLEQLRRIRATPGITVYKPTAVGKTETPDPAPAPARDRPAGATPGPRNRANGEDPLRKGPRKMLEAIARRHPEPLTKPQIGLLSGYAPGGGTFRTYFPQLVRLELVHEAGPGAWGLTPTGVSAASDVLGDVGNPSEIRAMWSDALPQGPRKMLEVLIEAYPNALTKAQLGELSGYTVSGGTFRTYFPKLRRLGLVEIVPDGKVAASQTLF